MDSSITDSINDFITDFDSTPLYYGVHVQNDNSDGPNVFQNKLEAMKVVKKNKKSRFKAFQFYHEALEFAVNGSECPNNNTLIGPLQQQMQPEPTQTIGEKASPFRGPKPQELVELRKAIEAGNYKLVKDTIWQNPRYLVSSGDTPSILQEGPRYNALHVAAKSMNAEITDLILTTVSNAEFIKLLYGDDNQQNAEDRTTVLLDLYLNTPNKGLNETPLHFASKHGAADVVEILISYPQCDKTLKNKFEKTAADIICERTDSRTACSFNRIKTLLETNYYVPVLRAEDNSLPPMIGEPFLPTDQPIINADPLSPRLEIHAYAGPMNKEIAKDFRKKWKTPPRSQIFHSPTLLERKRKDLVNVSALRLKDPVKGLERIGMKLANRYNIEWKEYWPFLDSFVDISSDEGLNLLENHLANQYAALCKYYAEEVKKKSPLSTSDPLSPISNLCAVFSACHLNESSRSQNLSADQKNDSVRDSIVYLDRACEVFANRISDEILYLLFDNNIVNTLEREIRRLEMLIISYMDDNRFSSINFQKVHSRLGVLIGQKFYIHLKEEPRAHMCGKIENMFESITKSVDCFSSDDEDQNLMEISKTRKPTIYKKQLICVIHYVINVLSQNCDIKQISNKDECIKDWEYAEACTCVYHRRSKKNCLPRSGSFRNNSELFGKTDTEIISRKLAFDDSGEDQNFVRNGINTSMNHSQQELSSDDEEDKFYTPPSSPSLLNNEESDEEFNDTELPKYDVYIEGDYPTKVDCDIFNALSYGEEILQDLDINRYPHIYKWYHNVSLYSLAERESWTNVKDAYKAKSNSPELAMSSSFSVDSPRTSTPSKKPWLRITGANSPRAVFKSYSMHV